jgi:hypothetical protein
LSQAAREIVPEFNMNDYDIALVFTVRQRGADATDAVDRALFNLGLRVGDELRNPEPSNCGAEAGPVVVLRRPNVIMIRPSEKAPPC